MTNPTIPRASLQEAQRLLEKLREGGSEALAAGLRAADILRETLGQEHPHVAGALLSTSYVCYENRDLDTAERLVREAMRIWRAQEGPERPEIAICLNNLGRIEEERGNSEKGVQLHRQAVDMRLRLLGDHPDTAFSLTNLGAALTDAGRWEEAMETLQKALACYERLGLRDEAAIDACRQNLSLCRKQMTVERH